MMLQGSDGEIFEVDVEIASQSVTIATTLGDLGMDERGDDDPAPYQMLTQQYEKQSWSGLCPLRRMITKQSE